MTNNELIAKWAGKTWHDHFGSDYSKLVCSCGKDARHCLETNLDYENSDQAAITLLPILVEKGYQFCLVYEENGPYRFDIWGKWNIEAIDVSEPTISSAICAAITVLIDKEGGK